MSTLYIDVYFLINLSVDILSLYFAALAAKIPATTRRTLLAGVIGAIYATVSLFIYSSRLLNFLLSVVALLSMTLVVANRVSLLRKVKLAVFFLGVEILLGGSVYYGYSLLDKYLSGSLSSVEDGVQNRNLLLLSLIVLLSIGVLKILISAFSSTVSLKSVKLKVVLFEKSVELEALVDSGNLAKDPMDSTPVMLIKKGAIKDLLGGEQILKSDRLKARIRMIPISLGNGERRIYTAIRPDRISLVDRREDGDISVSIAIDEEEGSYGGYFALMPAAALEDVI